MNPILLRYVGFALVASIFGVGGGFLAVKNKTASPPPVTQSGTIPAIPAQPHPGWRIPATPAVPAVPNANTAAKYNIKVLTPNGGERYTIGKDPVHVSWSGGLGKVWILLTLYAAPGGPTIDWWNGYMAILSDNGSPSGSFDWNGKFCRLELGLPATPIEGGTMGNAMTFYQTDDCKLISPGSYKIVAISQTDPNVPITYESLDWLLWYAAFGKNSNINFDLSDKPFTMTAQ